MAWSEEEIELHDPNVTWQRKLRLRARRFLRFGLGTFLALLATCLLAVLAGILFFGTEALIYTLE